jgi:hypothetical protein
LEISALSTIFLHGAQKNFSQRRKGAREKNGDFAALREPFWLCLGQVRNNTASF